MMTSLRRAAACACLGSLAACGGGGSDAGAPPAATTINAAAAWQNLLTSGHSWTVSGTGSDGNSYEFAITVTPSGAATFPVSGATTSLSSAALSIKQNGTLVASGVSETYFDSTLHTVGYRNVESTATTCELAVSPGVPPTVAAIGASGPIDQTTQLDGCSATSTATGSGTDTWSVEASGGITYFCTNSSEQDASSSSATTEADCFEVDADGTLGSKARVTITGSGVSVTASN
jgi:hypothetical protein